jgi:hypothetical protein
MAMRQITIPVPEKVLLADKMDEATLRASYQSLQPSSSTSLAVFRRAERPSWLACRG